MANESIDLEELLEVVSGGGSQEQSMIRTQTQPMHLHTVFFDRPIGEASEYRSLIHALDTASEFDQFDFKINSPGGRMDATMSIIEAIKNTDATVRAIITGECHSAASIIALNCHQVQVTESGHSLIHTASYGSSGNSHMIKSHVDFYTRQITNLIKRTYEGFLTEAELEDVSRGVEIWVDSEDFIARLKSRSALIESKNLARQNVAEPKAKKKKKK